MTWSLCSCIKGRSRRMLEKIWGASAQQIATSELSTSPQMCWLSGVLEVIFTSPFHRLQRETFCYCGSADEQ